MKHLKLLLAFCLFAYVKGECPYAISEVPVLYDDDTFLCTRRYGGPGDDDVVQACNEDCYNEYVHEWDGMEDSSAEGTGWPIGSLIVLPGCTFYGFSDYNFAGDIHQYDGGSDGLTVPNVYGFMGFYEDYCTAPSGYGSKKCRCIQKMISCTPTDDYSPVLVCDATLSEQPISCTYAETVGTSYTSTATESASVSEAVSETIHAGLGNIFSNDLGISATTGYDWSTAESETYSTTKTTQMSTDAPPGYIMTMDQAVGYCDGNESKANFFRIETTPGSKVNGKKTVHYEKRLKDGTMVRVPPPQKQGVERKLHDAPVAA